MDEYGYMIPRQQKTNHLCYSKSDLGPSGSGYGPRHFFSPLDQRYSANQANVYSPASAVADVSGYSTVTRLSHSFHRDFSPSPPVITPLKAVQHNTDNSNVTPQIPPPAGWVQLRDLSTSSSNHQVKRARLRYAHSECDIIDSCETTHFDPQNRHLNANRLIIIT